MKKLILPLSLLVLFCLMGCAKSGSQPYDPTGSGNIVGDSKNAVLVTAILAPADTIILRKFDSSRNADAKNCLFTPQGNIICTGMILGSYEMWIEPTP